MSTDPHYMEGAKAFILVVKEVGWPFLGALIIAWLIAKLIEAWGKKPWKGGGA